MKKSIMAALMLSVMSGCAPATGGTSAHHSSRGSSCNSAASCQNIGLKYAGRGDQKNYAIAAGYFERACAYGLSEGCNNLGFLYANARGVKQSYTLAYEYWEKACRMGNDSACANLDLAKEKVAEMHRRKGR